MEKENLKEEFLKSLKVALNNSLIYFKDHPLVLRSIEDLHKKINDLIKFVSPIRIIASKDTLFLENKLEDSKLNKELAEFLHFRKIKSIEFYSGISFNELLYFVFNLGKPIKDIFKAGGLTNILKNKDIKNIIVEELDYSELLLSEGKELKDIWVFLVRDFLNKDNLEKIDLLINNFSKILNNFDLQNFLKDKDFQRTIFDFLSYLEKKRDNRLRSCSKELLRFFLKNNVEISDFEKLSYFFKVLSNLEFLEIFIDELIENGEFDEKAFSLLLGIAKLDNKTILENLEDRFKNLSIDFKTKKRIRKLFFESNILQKYNYNFSPLLKYIDSKEFTLEYNLPFENYFKILLYLLKKANSENTIKIIVENFLLYWDEFEKIKDMKFFEELFVTFLEKKLLKEFWEFIYKVKQLIEDRLIQDDFCFKTFNKNIFKNIKNIYNFEFYLDLIFNKKKINTNILFLCFNAKNFNSSIFLKFLKLKIFDEYFINKLIDCVKEIDSKISFEILKYIYHLSKSLRQKALIAMQNLSLFDEDFLFSLLKNKDKEIRKNAIIILLKNNNLKEKVLCSIFCIFNPFGIKNRFIIENINIIKELNLGFLLKDLKCLKKFRNLLSV